MESFPIVKRKDVAAHGTFRTKDMILEVYDAMQAKMVIRESVLVDFSKRLKPLV